MPSEPRVDIGGPPRRTSRLTPIVSGGAALLALGFFLFRFVAELAAASATGTSTTAGASTGSSWTTLLPLALVVLILLVRPIFDAVGWWFRTYQLLSTELVIDEGVMSRHHRVLPYARVQQVDVHQSFVAQIFRVAELRIASAGEGDATTMRLRFLEKDQADELRRFILDQRAALQATDRGDVAGVPLAASAPAIEPPLHTLLQLGPGKLVAAALSDAPIVAGAPLVGLITVSALAYVGVVGSVTSAAAAMVPIAIVVVILVASLLWQQVVGRWNFAIGVQGDDLHVRYGLFEVRQLTIPRRRVQQITIEDNPLRRTFGAVSLTLHSAVTGGREQSTKFTVPWLPQADVDGFLGLLMGDSSRWRTPTLEPRPPRAQRRAIVRRTVVIGVLLVPLVWITFPWGVIALVVAAVGVPWGLAAHRFAGHAITDDLVVFAKGVVRHTIELVPLQRAQSARTTASPFQRWSNLATFHTDVAGDPIAPRLYDMDATTAEDLLRTLPRTSVSAAATSSP